VVKPQHVLAAAGQTPPSGKITLGVIGVGAQGQSDLRDFLRHDDLRVRAIYDVNQRNLENARRIIAERYGHPDVKVFGDFRELNADPSIDAVLMALPVHWHSIPALDAILHGRHIYHEKPMALSFEEARRVRAAVRSKGVVFQFGTQQRSDTKFRWACELALNGRLGKLRKIRVSVPAGRQGALLPEQPVPDYLDWNRWVGPAPLTPFHLEKLQRDTHENITNFSLGMISCWGIHHLDIAQWGNDADALGPRTVEGAPASSRRREASTRSKMAVGPSVTPKPRCALTPSVNLPSSRSSRVADSSGTRSSNGSRATLLPIPCSSPDPSVEAGN
jgi:Oxidoreductase family, NAD-binding Rossmann fold/Oxidoreductase family, C-terminal alpha/beta domain